MRASSCNTEQLTSVATEVRRLQKKPHPLKEQDPTPTSAHETPGYRFVTGRETAEIVRLYAAGVTATDVSEKTGRPLRTVTDVLRRHGVEIRRQFSRVDVNSSEVERLYRSGQSIRKIAENMSVRPYCSSGPSLCHGSFNLGQQFTMTKVFNQALDTRHPFLAGNRL